MPRQSKKKFLIELHKEFILKDDVLYNRYDRGGTCYEGECSGCLHNASGYIVINFRGVMYKAHRLIFLMYHGYLPKEIDHINGVRDDNRIANLRACTHAENCRNSKLRCTSKSGVKGVSWNTHAGKWLAQIAFARKNYYLGVFDDIELAELVVSEAREVLHGKFSRQA